MSHKNERRAHPVRNFFYVVYSLFNLVAFLAFFYALYAVTFPMRGIFLVVAGGALVLALAVGVFRPLFCRGGR